LKKRAVCADSDYFGIVSLVRNKKNLSQLIASACKSIDAKAKKI
jgi:hypothetical protein